MGEHSDFKRFFNLYGTKFLSSLALSIIIFLSIFLTSDRLLINACDALFYSFAFCFASGALSWITNLGFFDIFAYCGIRLKAFITDYKDKEKSDFYGVYDYTKSKELKRKDTRFVCLSYFVASLFFLIPFIITYVVFKTTVGWSNILRRKKWKKEKFYMV